MRVCLALLAVLALAGTANGAAFVWFEATLVEGTGGVTVQGAPGVTAETWSEGHAVFDIDVMVRSYAEGTPPGLVSYGIGVIEEGPCPGVLGDWVGTIPAGWTPDGVGDFMTGAYTFGAPVTGDFLTAQFTLTKEGFADWDAILGYTSGSFGWGAADFMVPNDVYIGGTMLADGFPGTAGAYGLINQCVPEPATIALLGFGVLALIRRR